MDADDCADPEGSPGPTPAAGGRRQLAARVRDSEEPFRLLVESIQDYAIFMLDPGGTVSTWNAGAERIKGYRAEEIVGQHFSRFYPPEDLAARKPQRALEIAARTGRYEDEGWRVRKDGSRFWASVVITALFTRRGALRGYAKVTRDLTARVAAEETARRLAAEVAAREASEAARLQLLESEDRYRRQGEELAAVLAAAADGITVQEPSGRVLYANDAAARICGFASARELIEAQPDRIVAAFELFDEEGRPFPRERLPGRRVLAGERCPATVIRVRHRATGVERWSVVNATPVGDAAGRTRLAVNAFHDITELHQARESARFLSDASAALTSDLGYQETLDRLAHLAVPRFADGCAVDLAEDGRLVRMAVAHANPARAELALELERRYPTRLGAERGAGHVAVTGRSELYEEVSDALMAATARDEEHLRLIRALSVRSGVVVPIVARGRPLGAITFVHAESGRRYGAAELEVAKQLGERAGLALENARLYRESLEAVRLRDDFLSVAGHELRTPLTAFMFQAQSLLNKAGTGSRDEIRQRAEKLARYGDRLAKLVDELLDVSRITAGRLSLEREELDLGALATDLVARAADEIARAGATVRLDVRGAVRGTWDRIRVEQVLGNLLGNALKYGRGGPIDVRVEPADGVARLVVRDRGIGIAPEDQARIFERFERAISSRHFSGLGLGLWIARQVVEAHGGSIQVRSAPGEGAEFTVELPLGAVDAATSG